jgi:hypothetical protein
MLIKLRIKQRQPARAKKNRVTVEFDDVKSFCEAVRFPDDNEEEES